MLDRMIPALAFWVAAAVLVYTFVGYGRLMRLLARTRTGSGNRPAPIASTPSVTVVVVAYNEEHRIGARILNLLESEYGKSALSVFVVSDGSTDSTVQTARAVCDP